jgi:hypothetical protein
MMDFRMAHPPCSGMAAQAAHALVVSVFPVGSFAALRMLDRDDVNS